MSKLPKPETVTKIIVTGGRAYLDWDRFEAVLKEYPNVKLIIEGGAHGADACGRAFAEIYNIQNYTYEADWDDLTQPDARIKYTSTGKPYDAQAGHRRNYKMLSENTDALVIAFPGGHGTANCVKNAKSLKMNVRQIG